MNETDLQVVLDLQDEPAVTAHEMQLLADLLPELVKDLLWLQDNTEG